MHLNPQWHIEQNWRESSAYAEMGSVKIVFSGSFERHVTTVWKMCQGSRENDKRFKAISDQHLRAHTDMIKEQAKHVVEVSAGLKEIEQAAKRRRRSAGPPVEPPVLAAGASPVAGAAALLPVGPLATIAAVPEVPELEEEAEE